MATDEHGLTRIKPKTLLFCLVFAYPCLSVFIRGHIVLSRRRALQRRLFRARQKCSASSASRLAPAARRSTGGTWATIRSPVRLLPRRGSLPPGTQAIRTPSADAVAPGNVFPCRCLPPPDAA